MNEFMTDTLEDAVMSSEVGLWTWHQLWLLKVPSLDFTHVLYDGGDSVHLLCAWVGVIMIAIPLQELSKTSEQIQNESSKYETFTTEIYIQYTA